MTTAQPSEIKEFFKGKTVLITGTTGFVGKTLLEKMIRSFPDIGRIYILLRAKGTTLEKRVSEQIFSTHLFQPLFQSRPELPQWIKEKIFPVEGDIASNGLGIKPDDRHKLTEEV